MTDAKTPETLSLTPARQAYLKDSMAILKNVGKMSRADYIKAMCQMEEKYPGKGWAPAANAFEDWCMKWGKPLNEKPKGPLFEDKGGDANAVRQRIPNRAVEGAAHPINADSEDSFDPEF